MKINTYITLLVLSCSLMGFLGIGVVFYNAQNIDNERNKVNILNQEKVQAKESLLILNQWLISLDLYLNNKQAYMYDSMVEQSIAIKYLNEQLVKYAAIELVDQKIDQIMKICSKGHLKGQTALNDNDWYEMLVKTDEISLGIHKPIDAVILSLDKEIDEKKAYLATLNYYFDWTAWLAPILFVLFSLMMLKWSNNKVVKPIKNLTELAKFGSNCDFCFIPPKNPLEVTNLANSLNNYIAALLETRQQAWQEARQSEYTNARIVNIMETAADAIICTDSRGNIIQMNASFRRLVYLNDEYDGELVCHSFLPDIYLDDYIHDAMDSFVSVEQTYLINTQGDNIAVELSISHFSYEEVLYFTMVLRDIRERENMQQQILQAQKMESVGTLAAGIAHEINTPTQYIKNYFTFLDDSFEDLTEYLNQSRLLGNKELDEIAEEIDLDFLSDEIPKALNGSKEGLDKVSEIVRSMKVMAHPTKSEKVSYNINSLLREAVILTKSQWKKFAEVKFLLDEGLPEVPCYPGLLSQTFINIIINASQAIEEQIENQTFETLGMITIRTSIRKRNVMIKISDTGIGVDQKFSTKIFDPFFTTKEVGVGTGQGLALSHDFVVGKHGGSISFDSNAGLGCSFTILIPLD